MPAQQKHFSIKKIIQLACILTKRSFTKQSPEIPLKKLNMLKNFYKKKKESLFTLVYIMSRS